MKLHTPRESYLWLKSLWNHSRTLRMSRAELEAAQLVKFRRLVAHAQAHSPYYRTVIGDLRIDASRCAPTDFPVLTKKEVAENFDEMITDRTIKRRDVAEFLERSKDPQDRFRGKFHVLHTSGTSGTIGYYIFRHEEWIKGASQIVRASPLKLRRRVGFVAATRGHFAGISLMLAGNDGTNRLFYEVRPFDVCQPLSKIIEGLNRFQPDAVTGYASILNALGEARERGELKIHPKHLGSGGEPLPPQTKAFLERVFGIPVMNGYASSEHLYMAMNLPGLEGMHLMEDDLMFELQSDHTCVTNLFNTLLPLVRYRMDDVLVPEANGHSPYPFRRVREIIGRHEEALTFVNEHGKRDFIHQIVIVELMISGLSAWQVILTGDESFRFRARLEPHLTEAQRERTLESARQTLTGILREKEMSNVWFEIETVESLPTDPVSGKFRLIVRETPPSGAMRAPNSGAVLSEIH